MKPEEAHDLAETFLRSRDMRGHKAVFAEVRSHHRWPDEFSVIFDVFTEAGNLVDGSLIVIVDKLTREARIFE